MTFSDKLIREFDLGLRTITGTITSSRPTPVSTEEAQEEHTFTTDQKRHIAGLMRVNHAGEICAQALYQSQKLSANSQDLKDLFNAAATEEEDHLGWTQNRLQELGAHISVLSPLWYLGAFTIGCIAGSFGKATSLGFMAETERQVEQHLGRHLDALPIQDKKSRAILQQMQLDEIAHGQHALSQGGRDLPILIKTLMRLSAKVMTTTAYYL